MEHTLTSGKRPLVTTDNSIIEDENDTLTLIEPESELYALQDTPVPPKFNQWVTQTLDLLMEEHKPLCKDFIRLPSRKFFPDYFHKIESPISLIEIQKREYTTIQKFLLDVELIYKNCAAYNEAESLIIKNALQVVNLIRFELLKKLNWKRNYLCNDIVTKLLGDLLQKVIKYEDKEYTADPFLELITKEELPEYHLIINTPIALNVVKARLKTRSYGKLYDFYCDVELIFMNGTVFNEKDSYFYLAAQTLLKFFRIEFEKLLTKMVDDSKMGEINLEIDKLEFQMQLADEEETEGVRDVSVVAEKEYNITDLLENRKRPRSEGLISQFTLATPQALYKQMLKQTDVQFLPLFEYVFKPQMPHESFTVSLPPLQSAISVAVELTGEYNALLKVNKEKIAPSPSVDEDDELVRSKYEIKLAGGLNVLEYFVDNEGEKESCTIWLNVIQ